MLKYEMMSQDKSERVIYWNMKYVATRVKGNESWLNVTRLAWSETRVQKRRMHTSEVRKDRGKEKNE